MDAANQEELLAALSEFGALDAQGQPIPGHLAFAAALIERLEEALRRTVAASHACPYCETPTYLRRHQPGCGINQALVDAQAWLAERR